MNKDSQREQSVTAARHLPLEHRSCARQLVEMAAKKGASAAA